MMRLLRGPLGLLFVLLALQVSGASAFSFDPKTMMDTPEIKRGMIAYGKTVFVGGTITTFKLAILDVMSRANAGGDMILAKALDGPCVERNSGIIGGMSGTPVYIDGRLVGAIAYGWSFNREPIAGITAIRDMLESMDIISSANQQQGTLPGLRGTRWTSRLPVRIGGKSYHAAEVVDAGETAAPGVMPLRLVGPAISCTGLGPRALELATQTLKPFGLQPLQTGGAQAPTAKLTLEPGAALGIRLMEGDFDMTGIGTVTYRDGDRLLGFGHPMMQRGRVAMPICTAWIHDFIPSVQRSDKLGSGVTDVGTLQADTAWSVGGTVGAVPPMRPVRIEIYDKTRDLRKQFNVRVMVEKGVTPGLLATGIASALEAAYNPGYEGMLKTEFEVLGTRGVKVSRSDRFYVTDTPVGQAVSEVLALASMFEENRWEPQDVERVTFRAELEASDDTAFIEKVRAQETVAKAGKELHLTVQVRPDSGEPRDYPFTLQLPRDLPKGALRIAVVGGQEAMLHRQRLGILLPQFDSLADVLSYYERTEQSTELCVIAALPQSTLLVGTTQLRRVPNSLGAMFGESPRTDMEEGREEMTLKQELPWVIYGRLMIALPTEDRQGGKGTVTATKPSAEPTKGAEEESVTPRRPPEPLWWAAAAYGRPTNSRQWGSLQTDSDNKPRPLDPTDKTARPKEMPPPPAGAARETNPIAKEDEEKEEEEGEEGKPVLRQPTTWTQDNLSDFSAGEEDGVALHSDGGLALAPAITDLGDLPELYVTAALDVGGTTYLATASPGRIYKLSAEGKPEVFYDTGEFAVKSLVADAAGVLYAGTFPGGRVHRVTGEGQGSVFCQLPADYVWALAFGADGRLLAGVGPGARLFAVDATGQGTELVSLPQVHLMSLLAVGPDIYLGTAGSGLIYRLNAERQLTALYDAGEQDVTCLAADAQGCVYAGLATEGRIVRLAAGKAPEVVFQDKDRPVYALAAVGDRLYVGTGTEGQILALAGDSAYDLVRDTPATHALCLWPAPDGSLLCGLASPGKALRLSPGAAAEGTFTSAVMDAERPAQWGLVDWLADLPAGAALGLQTRSGNSNDPEDGSWSAWSASYTRPGVDRITSPPGRYLQYRLTLSKAPGDGVPFLRRLSLSYLPVNQRPEIKYDAPAMDKPARGEVEIKWTASDADKDQLAVTVEYRAAGGEWQKLAALPADKKSHKWDTSKLPDGIYDLRLTASDEPSNPGSAQVREVVLRALVIDNAKPGVQIAQTTAEGGRLQIAGTATDNHRVVEVAYQQAEQWYGVAAADGQYDSTHEAFVFSVPLEGDKAQVKLQVRDAAGNVYSQTVKWPQ